MTGRVLIVMRTKNRPLLLGRALDSVLAQTHGDWRLMVVNDGGEAGPVDALIAARQAAFAGRSRVIHNPASVGMEAASNIALRSETADFAVIHDDDDSWLPEFLAVTTATLAALPERWGGVVTRSHLVREQIEGDTVREIESLEFNAGLTQITIGDLAAVNQFPPIAFLYRTAVLDKIGYYREDLPVLGDWEFNLRLIQHFDIKVIRPFLANWHHRVPEKATSDYGNSFHATSHDQFAAMLRNEALRIDLAAGRFGIGELMSRNSAMLADLRARHDAAEQALHRQHEVLMQRDAALAQSVERERGQAQQIAHLELHRLQLDTHRRELETSLAGLRQIEAALRADIDKLNHDANLLQGDVRALNADKQQLQGEVECGRVALSALSQDLANAGQETAQARHVAAEAAQQAEWLRHQLQQTHNSTSWRLTRPVRWAGHAARRVRGWLSAAAWRWRRHSFTVEPLRNIVEADGGYEATGYDPQLLLVPQRRRLPQGFVLISYEGQHEDGYELSPSLFVDAGNGFLPGPYYLSAGKVLHFLPQSVRLRVDPLETDGSFRFNTLTIIEVGRISLLVYRLLSALRLLVDEPAVFVRRARRLLDRMGKGNGIIRAMMINPASQDEPYENWVHRFDTISRADRRLIRAHVAAMTAKPTISILMPVYNPPVVWLRRAIESVRRQLYPNWELCIADDASTDPDVRRILDRAARADARIKVVYRQQNGHISAASNSALELATGEFVALLDNDDELAEHALYYVAVELQAYPDTDLIYSDEDKVDTKGRRFHPYFKPDWNPDLMLSQNVVGHLAVYRRALLQEIGGFRLGFEGAQDYDLVLRAAERAGVGRIRHIPRILYHWRSIEGSTALGSAQKSYAWSAGKRAIEEALARRGTPGAVEEAIGQYYRIRYPLPATPPRVSLIIPTRDRVDLLRNCVRTILDLTDYPDVEIVIVDNDSELRATLEFFREIKSDPRVRVLKIPGPFNFSRLNNLAVKEATGEIIGLVNNDIEIYDGGWLKEMAAHALRPEIGAVGAKLLYADGRVQHGGVTLGTGGVAGHLHRFADRSDLGYFGRAAVVQNLSAVTAACLLLRRSVFEEVGGLDEANLAVAFNDVDFCLRIRARGYQIVWTPFAEMFHLESATRGSDDTEARRPHFQREIAYMLTRWRAELRYDPAYNPNLSLDTEHPEPAFPPRLVPPWRPRPRTLTANRSATLSRSA